MTVIATGFGDRFDMEKGRAEQKVTRLQDLGRVNLETPTFVRRAEQPEPRRVPVRQASFISEEDDQYDIPTFLRKSVD